MTDSTVRRCMDTLSAIVATMRCCDPEYCKSHGLEETTDDEWDDVLQEAEDLLDDLEESEAMEQLKALP